MTKKAKLYGNRANVEQMNVSLPPEVASNFELKEHIELSTTRSHSTEIKVDFEENDLVALHFSDQTEWIGHPEDIQEIYEERVLKKRSTTDDDYVFDTQISTQADSRGSVKQTVVKFFSIFKPKNSVAAMTMTALGVKYDKKIQPNPGLYTIDKDFKRAPFKKSKGENHYLLLIHGTISSSIDGFGQLNESDAWGKLLKQYNDNVMAFDHYTLSESPLKNALDFLKSCPDKCNLDIMSHSRGGLVADVLAKCDYNNNENQEVGFSKNEQDIFLKKKEKATADEKDELQEYDLIQEINKLAIKKQITVNKIVRVAAPANGTTILSQRADHFFNLLLNTISLAFGIKNPLYGVVKSFLLELISQKDDPDVLPGLNSMIPGSLFQKMLNAADTTVESDLYNIIGDSEVGGVSFESLKVILTNLFYREANDFVVDTSSMIHGVKRIDGFYRFMSQDSDTNHFNYFKNKNSCDAILEALVPTEATVKSLYTKEVYANGQRGILLDKLSMAGAIYKEPEIITRDVMILIPGIMGSTLSAGGKEQWIQMRALNKGAIVDKLDIDANNVEASGVVEKFYKQFADHFSSKYDVVSYEFDWRKSVSEAAVGLEALTKRMLKGNVNVHIVAHSMGGLLTRQFMMDFPETWNAFIKPKNNKFVMLGTPWLGSYLIMEVLTGHSRRVKQLAMIDFRNDKEDLLEIFWKFPGVFELLPIEEITDRKFWTATFWNKLKTKAKLDIIPNLADNKKSLSDFSEYRSNVLSFLKDLDSDEKSDFFDKIYYVCGKADKTVCDYSFKNRFLSRRKKLIYKATSHGDGSVTWKTGIPKQLLKSNNLYYCNTSHGELANEPSLFDGVMELLERGKTNKLLTQPTLSRGGAEVITDVHEYVEPLADSEAVVDAVFGTEKQKDIKSDAFGVTVVNGDLKEASYPVMTGHFFMDLILSAEKALDVYLNGRLSQRMGIGYYPGKIGESEVFFNLGTKPKGAIICGLGATETLTQFLLSKTVKLAALKYAMFMRDNYTLPEAKKYASGISFILMGIGYGKLPIEESLKGILLGVAKANVYLKNEGAKQGLKPIANIEIINYYESIASQAYFTLNNIIHDDIRIPFRLHKEIIRRTGAKKRQSFKANSYVSWYNLHITHVNNKESSLKKSGFKYYASNGLARVEEEFIAIDFKDIKHLLSAQAHISKWDKRLSNSLFSMLIPNDFKNVFRNQGNLIIKVDKRSAEIPWELLHDSKGDDMPIAVSSTFIRQLVTSNIERFLQVGLNNKNVLVIGDPIYNDETLPQLPAAKAEAERVVNAFDANSYQTYPLINESSMAITNELYNQEYKIMHFAGHGLYDIENDKVGIAIGDDIFIDPQKLRQIGYVPEFVFINCCYSGAMNAKDDTYSRDRYRLAANVGTQLIEMGVKAIIISGWAVDDAAAKDFSETFYKNMFLGYNFGTSVQKARMSCFQNHKNTNTWGAYQCYGNQFYTFTNRKHSKEDVLDYVIDSQVHTDLDNLLNAIRDRKNNKDKTLQKLNVYLEKAEKSNLLDAIVLEKEALIYNELDEYEIAYQKFKELFKYGKGTFSIAALEQYCIIKTRKLTKATLEEELREIELLCLVGENSSRLNIIANAYKFASMRLKPSKKPKGKTTKAESMDAAFYLSKAFTNYQKSFSISNDIYDAQCLDAMTNMIFIGHILESLGEKTISDHLETCEAFSGVKDVRTHVLTLYKDIHTKDTSNVDLEVRISIAEAQFALVLFKNNFVANAKLDMISKFKDVFLQLYSPRYINIELMQIGFLEHYNTDEIIKIQLKQIKEEIHKLEF